MSEWDEPLKPDESQRHSISAGPWDAGMTIVALVAVAATSSLVSYFTKDIPTRP